MALMQLFRFHRPQPFIMPVRTNCAHMARKAVEIPHSLTDSGDHALINVLFITFFQCLALWVSVETVIDAMHHCKMLYP